MPNSELTRRKLLAGLAAAGGAGAGVGTGTSALLTDEVGGLSATLAAGTLDLTVNCVDGSCKEPQEQYQAQSAGISSNFGGGGGGVGDQSEGSAKFKLTLEGNPGYVWLGMDCLPEEDEGPGENLKFTVWLENEDHELGSWSSLSGFRDALDSGILLTPDSENHDYFDTGTPYTLTIEWEEDSGQYGTSTVNSEGWPGYDHGDGDGLDLQLEFKAKQRRHDDGQDSPFDRNGLCAETDTCLHCVALEKIENEGDSRLKNDKQYQLSDGDTEYALTISDVEKKNEGEITGIKFDISSENASSVSVCRLEVKGGRDTKVYEDLNPSENFARAPKKNTGNSSSGESSKRHEISNFTVSVCSEDVGADDPMDGEGDD